jgi:DNA-binding IclR family transcriptional regulator
LVVAKDGQSSGSQAVERAMLLLRLVVEADEPHTIQTLVAATKLNRTTVWRLLTVLEDHGYVARLPGYAPGPAALRLGQVAAKPFGPLVRAALPAMRELLELTSETVTLGVPYGAGTMTIAQLDSPHAIRLRNYLFEVSPLTRSSTGKALLSTYSPQEVLALGGEEVAAEVEQARQAGFAVVVEELAPGENGLAAPILVAGQAVALLNVAGPSFRFSLATMQALAPALTAACATVERLLN